MKLLFALQVSASAPCTVAPGTSSSSVSSLEPPSKSSHSLSEVNGVATTPRASNLTRSVEGFHEGGDGGGGLKNDGGAFGVLQSPLPLPEGRRAGAGAADSASRQGMEAIVGRNADIVPETPVMAVMEVRALVNRSCSRSFDF